jgi:lysophospholipase L1-like esterase
LALGIGLAVSGALTLGCELHLRRAERAWRRSFDLHATVASSNPVLLWEYRPGASVEVPAGRDVYAVTINAHGFRDAERARVPGAGVERVAFVGDSVVFGLGVARGETLAVRYEEQCNERDVERRVEALNFGIDGYAAPQVLELLVTRVLAFAPERVVYVFCLNDFDFERASGNKIRYFREPPASFVLERLRRFAGRLGQRRGSAGGGEAAWHRGAYAENRDVVFDALREMRARLAREGIGFELVVVPVFFRNESEWSTYRLRGMHAEIAAFLDEAGIAGLDLLEAFEASGRGPRELARDFWHLSPEGHRVAASALFDRLGG